MKKYFIMVIILFLYSCRSKNKIIETYLKQDTNTYKNLDYVLAKQKTDFNEIFKFFKLECSKLPNAKKEFNELELKYSKKNNGLLYWLKKDFKDVDFKIIDKDSLISFIDKRNQNLENKYYVNKFNFYYLSEPFYFNNNKNVFFSIRKFGSTNGMHPVYSNLIIMKKEKGGKWVLVSRREIGDIW